jgi:hypothetical protein
MAARVDVLGAVSRAGGLGGIRGLSAGRTSHRARLCSFGVKRPDLVYHDRNRANGNLDNEFRSVNSRGPHTYSHNPSLAQSSF